MLVVADCVLGVGNDSGLATVMVLSRGRRDTHRLALLFGMDRTLLLTRLLLFLRRRFIEKFAVQIIDVAQRITVLVYVLEMSRRLGLHSW